MRRTNKERVQTMDSGATCRVEQEQGTKFAVVRASTGEALGFHRTPMGAWTAALVKLHQRRAAGETQ